MRDTSTPTRTAPPGPQSGTFGGITFDIPDSSTSSTPDLYSVGNWQTQQVDPGDLPFLTDIIKSGQATTGEAVVKAFAQSDPGSVATIQHALMMAGYYTGEYQPRYGVISPDDIKAFGQAVTVAGQAGMPVAQLLTQSAAYGATEGIAAAQAQVRASASGQTTVLPNTQNLEAQAINAYQQVLGRKATDKEAARFAAAYRAMVAAHARAQSGQLAGEFASQTPEALVGEALGMNQDAGRPPGMGLAGNLNPNVNEGEDAPDLAGNMNPMVNTGGGRPGGAPDPFTDGIAQAPRPGMGFSERIAGLMSLGQSSNEALAGSAQGGGGTVDDTVDPTVAATNYARAEHPKEAAANDVANTFNMFLSLLGQSFGG
jgi:hypothetical protein